MEERLKLAEQQRFEVLKSAFSILDQFAIPSLDPDQYHNYGQIKTELTNRYRLKK